MNIKEFLKVVMSDDETNHKFSTSEKVLYGVLVPLGLIALMCLGGWIDTLCCQ